MDRFSQKPPHDLCWPRPVVWLCYDWHLKPEILPDLWVKFLTCWLVRSKPNICWWTSHFVLVESSQSTSKFRRILPGPLTIGQNLHLEPFLQVNSPCFTIFCWLFTICCWFFTMFHHHRVGFSWLSPVPKDHDSTLPLSPSHALVHSPLSMVCASSTVKVCFTTSLAEL